MSSSMMRGTRQSGSIIFWLVLVTAAIGAVLVWSWMFQGSSRVVHGRLPAPADQPTAGAHKELKLLASKVVSSVIVPQADIAALAGQSTDFASSEFKNAEPSLQSINTDSGYAVAELVTNSVVVDRTPGTLEPVGESGVENLASEPVVDDTEEPKATESADRIDQSEKTRSKSMQMAFLGRSPARVLTPRFAGESSSAAHDNHELSQQPQEVDAFSPGATSSGMNTQDGVQESTPHEIHDEVRIESAGLQFRTGSKTITEPMRPILSRVIEILSGHDDAKVVVAVATNESGDQKQDLRLSQERGRSIIARLVSSGIDFSRVSLEATSGNSIPENSHIVDVQAWMLSD